jgi:hypothetical protein
MDILKDFYITFSLAYEEKQKVLVTDLVFNLFLAVYPIERDKILLIKPDFYAHISILMDKNVAIKSHDALEFCLLDPFKKKLFEENLVWHV